MPLSPLGTGCLVIVVLLVGSWVANIDTQELLDDGDCSNPFNQELVDFNQDEAKWFKDAEGAGWYMPWMSQFYASVLYEVFHPRAPPNPGDVAVERKPLTFDDISTMCPTIHCSPENITIFRAYGKEFIMLCKQGRIGNLACTAAKHNVKVNLVTIWSDMKNYALMNTCFLGKKAWFLMSTTSAPLIVSMKPGTPYREMRNTLVKQNFKMNRSYTFNYTGCPNLV